MQCRTHPDKYAANTCNHCGSWLCADCEVEVQGRQFCRPCLAVLGQNLETTAYHIPPPPEHGAYPRRKILWGLLFMFSFLPGANYMYMGLMKRGLAAMSGFFLIIFLLANAFWPITLLLGLAMPVYVLTVFFDGFNVRRRINAGEAVRDDIGDALNGILANKTARTLILLALAIVLLVSVLGVAVAIIGRLIPVLIILAGIYLIFRRRTPTK